MTSTFRKWFMLALFIAAVALAQAFASWARADYSSSPLSQWKDHVGIVASSGWLGYKTDGGSTWSGVPLGGGIGLNDGALTVWGLYDHGFPANSSGQKDVARGFANLKIYPDGPGGANEVFIGGGALWGGSTGLKDWTGGEAHITGTHGLWPRTAFAATYLHGFATLQDRHDLDLYELKLVFHLFP